MNVGAASAAEHVGLEPLLANALLAIGGLLTLHINALIFSLFCVLMPRDPRGRARLSKAIGLLGTDLLACAVGLVLALGFLMISMSSFDAGVHAGQGLGTWDLVMIAVILFAVEGVYIVQLVRRFSGTSPETGTDQAEGGSAPARISWRATALYGLTGAVGALVVGHAVGDFADHLVTYLRALGVSEMLGSSVGCAAIRRWRRSAPCSCSCSRPSAASSCSVPAG